MSPTKPQTSPYSCPSIISTFGTVHSSRICSEALPWKQTLSQPTRSFTFQSLVRVWKNNLSPWMWSYWITNYDSSNKTNIDDYNNCVFKLERLCILGFVLSAFCILPHLFESSQCLIWLVILTWLTNIYWISIQGWMKIGLWLFTWKII